MNFWLSNVLFKAPGPCQWEVKPPGPSPWDPGYIGIYICVYVLLRMPIQLPAAAKLMQILYLYWAIIYASHFGEEVLHRARCKGLYRWGCQSNTQRQNSMQWLSLLPRIALIRAAQGPCLHAIDHFCPPPFAFPLDVDKPAKRGSQEGYPRAFQNEISWTNQRRSHVSNKIPAEFSNINYNISNPNP